MESPATIGRQDNGFRWRFTASLGLVVGVGAAVRIALLDQAMRNDEAVTAARFAVDLGTALTDYSAPNNHILHSILVNLSTSALGLEKWVIRLPAFLFALGLIVAVDWWISSATRRRSAGLFAAAFVAGSSLIIEYSTSARGYTMVAVAFVVLMEVSRRLLSHPSLRVWAVWVTVAVAGLMTVPVFVFPLSAVGTWLLLNVATGRSRQRGLMLAQMAVAALAVGALAVLAYLPAAATTGLETIVDNPFIQSIAWSELPGEWYRMTAKLAVMVWRDGVLAVLYSLLFITAFILNRSIFGRPLSPVFGMLGPLVIIVVRMVAPPQRIWLFVWPLVLGMAGAGLNFVLGRLVPQVGTNRLAVAGLAVAIATLMGLSTLASGDVLASREGGAFHDAEETVALLTRAVDGTDRIVVESHARIVLDWYLSPNRERDPRIARDYEDADRVFVVVYHPRPQTLEGVLETSGLHLDEFSDPVLRWTLPETDIYVMDRVS
jgi:hypothetical protein